MTDHAPIVWVDVETTGLDPDFDQLLEIAFVVTDADLEIKGIYSAVVHQPELVSMHDAVWRMHNESGLLGEVHEGGKIVGVVSREVVQFFAVNGVTSQSPLTGSTVHFDRSFIRHNLPVVYASVHYRNIDVSSLRELIKRWAPNELWEKGDEHRALPDILDSIEQLRHYRKVFGL